MEKSLAIKVELQDWFGSDEDVALSAWTSSTTYKGKLKKTPEDVSRVVNMLIDQKHSVPVESIVLRFWLRVPIATDRQIMTHRIASMSGMSGRYRTMPSDFLAVPKDVEELTLSALGDDGDRILDNYYKLCTKANDYYQEVMKQLKVARNSNFITNDQYKRGREFFRGVLPQHNMTERVMVINMRSFANFVKLRASPHAQPEIRQLAELMLTAVEQAEVAPITIEALKRNNWNI